MKNARFGNGLSLVLVLVLATLVAGVYARRASIRLATEFHGNYSGFIQLGRERFDGNPLVRDRPDIKRSVLLVDGDGYDGQFMYYMTFDPFMRRFDSYRTVVDYPPYRYGRIGFSLLTKLVSGDRWRKYPQAMIGLIILGIWLAAACFGMIGIKDGLSPWLGLIVVVIPGFWESLQADLPEPLAAATIVLGFWALKRGTPTVAGLAFAASLLIRETGLLFVCIAIANQCLSGRLRPGLKLALVSLLPFVAWRFYVGWSQYPMYGVEAFIVNTHDFGVPFGGIAQMLREIVAHNYYPWDPALSRSAAFYPVLIVVGLAVSIVATVEAASIGSVASICYGLVAVSLNFEPIWGAIGGAVRDTFEMFVAIGLVTSGWRSYSRPLRLALVLFWMLSAAYVFCFAADAQRIRNAFDLWPWH
jgi:hypothetical protein